MIQDILIPATIGDYALFSRTIIGIAVTHNHVTASYLKHRGKLLTIDRLFNEYGDPVELLTHVRTTFGNYDALQVAISSNAIIFKTATFPFADPKKISMVLNFELAPSLPFPIEEAVTDFIILEQNSTTKTTTVLAAIVQRKTIEHYSALLHEAGLQPTKYIPDLFALFGLIKNPLDGNALLYSTDRVTVVVGRTPESLITVQTIPFGTSHIKTGSGAQEFFNALTLAFESIKSYNHIIIASETPYPDLSATISDVLNIPCTQLTGPSFAPNIPLENRVSLGTAYEAPLNRDVNLLHAPATEEKLFKQRVTAMVLLLCMLFGILIAHNFLQTRALSRAIEAAQNGAVKTLKETLPLSDAKGLKTLARVVEAAQTKVEQAEKIWLPFSNEQRYAFVRYLQELSEAIDRENTGLRIKKLTIDDEKIVLNGEVKDYPEVRILEDELERLVERSPRFTHVSSIQDKKFDNLTLSLRKNEGGMP